MLDEFVKLKVSVHNAEKPLVTITFVRLETAWANQNTCAQSLERILRKNGHVEIADKLDKCHVVFKCFQTTRIHNVFGNKRTRVGEEMIATTFYMDLLGDTLPEIESDELMLNISLPEHVHPDPIIDATSLLIRQALSTSLLPSRKRFTHMIGEHNLYNEILNYVEENALGWTPQHIDSGKEFLSHITSAFCLLNENVRCLIII
jgi:hypothetical protein